MKTKKKAVRAATTRRRPKLVRRDVYSQRVEEVMIRDALCLDPQDTLADALVQLVENSLSALPVVDGSGKCLGMLSATDLLRLERELDERFRDPGELSETSARWLLDRMSSEGLNNRLVRDLMTTQPVFVRESATLAEAARLMLRQRVHRIVVLDERDVLVGILSTMDILKAFASGAPR
jgi:CBS domain-containing protein